MRVRAVWSLFAYITGLVLLGGTSVLLQKPDGSSVCNVGLGLEQGSDAPFTQESFFSSAGPGAFQGRLKDSDGAWCVAREDVDNQSQSASWWVDLGRPYFVTGHKAQGPPAPLASQDQGHTVSFKVHSSMDAKEWTLLHSKKNIYSTYTASSPDSITTINWRAAALGRYIRFSIDPSMFFADAKACMRFELLGCLPESTKLWTNLHLSSTETGTATLSWDVPLLWTGDEGAPVSPDDFTSSYFLVDATNKPMPEVKTNTGGKRQLIIHNAYLGAYYTFRVECVFSQANVIVDGGKINLSLFPTCPSNWLSSGNECYHSQKATLTWSEVLRRCKQILEDPSQASSSDPIPQGTKTWLAYKQSTEGNLEAEGDCSILSMSENKTAVQEFDQCASSTTLPFACIFQKQVLFARPQNFVVSQILDKSLKVTWTDSDNGWRTLSKNIKILDDKGLSDWAPYPAFGASFTLTGIEQGCHYTVTTAPGGVANFESLQHDTLTVFITSDGVLKNVALAAYVVWQGAIHLEWTEAVIESKDGKSLKAESYILNWTHSSESGSALQPLTTTSYDLQFPTFGEMYTFSLSCKLSGKIIPCGLQTLYTGVHRSFYDSNGSHLLLYNYNTEKLAWPDAQEECSKHGGHLASIKNEDEDKRVEELAMAPNPYWLGGTNCNGKTKTWVDNSKWTYVRPPVENFRNESCCLQVAPKDNKVNWQGADCKTKAAFVCRFDIAVSVSIVQDLTAIVISSTQILLQWKLPAKNWRPSYYSVQSCASGKCSEMTRMVFTPAAMVAGLSPATAYNIKVVSVVEQLEVDNEAPVAVKTAPIPALDYTVDSDGTMKLRWARKIHQGTAGLAKVKFVPVNSGSDAGSEFTGTASEIVVTGLKLENEYRFTVTDSSGDSDTITAIIRPSCPAGHLQYNSLCLWPTHTEGKWTTVNKACRQDGGRLANATETNKQLLMGVIANNKRLDHWIDGQELRTDTIQVDAVKTVPDKVLDVDALKMQDGASVEALQSGPKTSTDQTTLAELSKEIDDEGTCQKMKPDTQDIMKDDCTRSLPAICEKKVTVKLLPISNFTLAKVTETSTTIKWNPPLSWQPTAYKVILTQAGARRKRGAAINTEITENSYTAADLQPGTNYVFEVMPVIKQDDSTIEGKTEVIAFTTKKIDKPESSPAAPEALEAKKEEKSDVIPLYNCTAVNSLHTFHIIGCSVLVTVVGISLFIFLACRMHSFRDSLSQINMEVSLLIVHILLLINAASPNQMDFRSASISVHYFFMVTFAFFALECVCIAKAMTRLIPMKAFTKHWQIILAGWGVPLICIAFSAGLLYDNYPKIPSCWVNINSDMLYSTTIPIGFFCVVSLLLLVAAFCLRPTENYEVDEESFLRERVLENTRWVMLLLLVLMTVSWACGMVAAASYDETLFLVFIIVNVVLGVCILILRCFGDAEVRTRIRKCCSGGKVSPELEDPQIFLPTKEFPDPARFNKFTPPQTAIFPDKNQMMINRAYVFQP